MINTTYNLNQLVSVELCPTRQAKNFKFQPYRKRWYGQQNQGFIDTDWGTFYSHEDLMHLGKYNGTLFQIFNRKVYYRNYVRLKFSDGSKIDREFDQPMDAIEWAQQMKNHIPENQQLVVDWK